MIGRMCPNNRKCLQNRVFTDFCGNQRIKRTGKPRARIAIMAGNGNPDSAQEGLPSMIFGGGNRHFSSIWRYAGRGAHSNRGAPDRPSGRGRGDGSGASGASPDMLAVLCFAQKFTKNRKIRLFRSKVEDFDHGTVKPSCFPPPQPGWSGVV